MTSCQASSRGAVAGVTRFLGDGYSPSPAMYRSAHPAVVYSTSVVVVHGSLWDTVVRTHSVLWRPLIVSVRALSWWCARSCRGGPRTGLGSAWPGRPRPRPHQGDDGGPARSSSGVRAVPPG